MKKLSVILGIAVAVALFTLPVYAMGGGMGGGGMVGGGMMGNRGSGPMDWFRKGQDRSGYARPADRDRRQSGELDRRHQGDAAYMKFQIRSKEEEPGRLLNSTNPDMDRVRSLHRDIRERREEAAQEQSRYELEAGRINPGDGRGAYASPEGGASRGMGYGAPTGNNGGDR